LSAVRDVGQAGAVEPVTSVDDRFLNRELSQIDFNARVLALAEDEDAPLLERAKFLAIFASNNDEFYQVRVAGLKQQEAAGIRTRSADGLTPYEQLSAIASKVVPLAERHARLFTEKVMPALSDAGVKVLRWRELERPHREELNKLFREKIFPVLTPLAVDAGRPFPYISNLSLNLAVLVRDPAAGRMHFARIKVPPLLPRFVPFSEGRAFTPLEDVIAANLDQLFPGMEVVEHHTFRVTRNADLEIDDRADDLLEALEEELTKRRFSPAVRLEVEQTMPEHVLELLMTELEVTHDDVFMLPAPLDLAGLWNLHAIDRPDLKDEPYVPVTHPDLSMVDDEVTIFEVIGDRDVLVHHPYESFTTSMQRFIEEAAADPDVLAIKQTLYRTAGSPIVGALIEAAERGKQVVVLVEIKARFDESANIAWARTLEKAGCHVVYGLSGLKTHCKLCLVVREEGGELRQYVHVGTGNYNPITARIYEDMGLFTADPDLAAEVAHLFNYITGFSRDKKYRCMMVAPHGMRTRMISLIEREATLSTPERPGRIIMKMNNLADPEVVDALYAASQAGVRVDLIVRSVCTLRPGVEGLSKSIGVHSIVGRFLEHSRIFYFQNGDEEEVYIGSADMMERNLDHRVEVLAAVKSPEIRDQLKLVLDLGLSDNVGSWMLAGNGKWRRTATPESEVHLSLQEQLMRHSAADA
jgi:polyphosphate kinase